MISVFTRVVVVVHAHDGPDPREDTAEVLVASPFTDKYMQVAKDLTPHEAYKDAARRTKGSVYCPVHQWMVRNTNKGEGFICPGNLTRFSMEERHDVRDLEAAVTV